MALENACFVFTHALGHRVRNHISVSHVTSWFRLSLRLSMQLPHDASELIITNRCVFKQRQHRSLVRLYELSMSNISTVTLRG